MKFAAIKKIESRTSEGLIKIDIQLVNMLRNMGTPLPLENLKVNSHISMRELFFHSKRKSRTKSKKLQKKGGSQSNKYVNILQLPAGHCY